MNIVILGPQGSGKSTQAKLLADHLGIAHISTGKLLRGIAKDSKNSLHKIVKREMDCGNLVSNVIVNKVLNQAIENASKNGFVIDGTPRKIDQLIDLDELFKLHNQKVDIVFFLDVSDAEGKKRLLKRAKIEHRSDDTSQAIDERLKIYHSQTEPVLKEYEKRGILKRIDGNRPIETIQKDLQAVVKNYHQKL